MDSLTVEICLDVWLRSWREKDWMKYYMEMLSSLAGPPMITIIMAVLIIAIIA